MPVSFETYKRVVLEDTDERYELVCGHIRTKPLMTAEHGNAIRVVARLLIQQLDENLFEVCAGHGRLRVSTGNFYVPDLFVLPRAMLRRLLAHPGTFEVYEDPVPLVVEAWSPSTGAYDVQSKLQEYQIRGDAEIWRVHAYERTVTVWRRQPDGSYTETTYTSGAIQPVALPGVTIDIDRLWS